MEYYYYFVVDEKSRSVEDLLEILEEKFPDNIIVGLEERGKKHQYCLLFYYPLGKKIRGFDRLRFSVLKNFIPPSYIAFENFQNSNDNILQCIPSFPSPIQLRLQQTYENDFKLQNISGFNYSVLDDIKVFTFSTLCSKKKKSLFTCSLINKPRRGSHVLFNSSDKLKAKIMFKGIHKVGDYYCLLEMKLQEIDNNQGSKRGKTILAYYLLHFEVSETGYQPPSEQIIIKDKFVPKKMVWDGFKRERISLVEEEFNPDFEKPLGEYPVPTADRRMMMMNGRAVSFHPWMVQDNYNNFFHKLLYIEEIQRDINYSQYDIENRELSRFTNEYKGDNDTTVYSAPGNIFCSISIPGLSEGRPSLNIRDAVVVWPYIPKNKNNDGGDDNNVKNNNDNYGNEEELIGLNGIEFLGKIKYVFRETVIVEFHQKLLRHKDRNFNIRFIAPRIQFRRMHQAIDIVTKSGIWNFIFPTQSDISISSIARSQLFNHSSRFQPSETSHINYDDSQLQSIEAIVNSDHGKVPFILKGSFGTGKTVTLFQTLKLLLLRKPSSRILLCTRSASALDDYLLRFDRWLNDASVHFDAKLIYCFKAYFSKPYYHVQNKIKNYNVFTTYDPQLMKHMYPTLENLQSKRLILSTCDTSSLIYALGMPNTFFTHIFIDEAAQIMEPEALIPLSLANENTSVILAGDPEQIGPRLNASTAETLQLHRSLMERLVTTVYRNCAGNRRVMCNLTENYRIAKQIIALPSSIAYENTLTSKLNQPSITWNRVPPNRAPVVFYSVDGDNDERGEDSPSFFNSKECTKVCEILNQLFTDIRNLKTDDVIVIAPFYKQTIKLREYLRRELITVDGRGIRVQTPDGVQGLEAKVVIISATRSEFQNSKHDKVFDVGLKHRKRLVTSITRCSSLLIVVANPHNFCTNDDCYSVMKFANEYGVYHTDNLPFPDSEKVTQLKKEEKEIIDSSVLKYCYSEEFNSSLSVLLDRFPEIENKSLFEDETNSENIIINVNNNNDNNNDNNNNAENDVRNVRNILNTGGINVTITPTSDNNQNNNSNNTIIINNNNNNNNNNFYPNNNNNQRGNNNSTQLTSNPSEKNQNSVRTFVPSSSIPNNNNNTPSIVRVDQLVTNIFIHPTINIIASSKDMKLGFNFIPNENTRQYQFLIYYHSYLGFDYGGLLYGHYRFNFRDENGNLDSLYVAVNSYSQILVDRRTKSISFVYQIQAPNIQYLN